MYMIYHVKALIFLVYSFLFIIFYLVNASVKRIQIKAKTNLGFSLFLECYRKFEKKT